MIKRLLWTCLLSLVLIAPCVAQTGRPLHDITVVLDPGHGGDDWGVDPAGSGLREKDVTLDLANRIAALLREQGATVFFTRQQDAFISLNARVRFTNALLFRPNNGADHGRALSIHLNSNAANPNLTRVEVRVDPFAPVDDFAVQLAVELAGATEGGFGYRDAGYPPGVHPGDLAPVRWTFPRAANALTEAAFLSNPDQARQLRDAAWLDRIATAHVRALRSTLKR